MKIVFRKKWSGNPAPFHNLVKLKNRKSGLKQDSQWKLAFRADSSIVNLNAGFPVLSFTTAIPKSPDSHSTFPGKAHPFVCIPLFSALIQQALSPIISNSTQKVKTGLSRLQSTLFQLSFLKAGIYIHFKAAVRATAPYQPISSVFFPSCLNLEL